MYQKSLNLVKEKIEKIANEKHNRRTDSKQLHEKANPSLRFCKKAIVYQKSTHQT